jgi:hypothetical protein
MSTTRTEPSLVRLAERAGVERERRRVDCGRLGSLEERVDPSDSM